MTDKPAAERSSDEQDEQTTAGVVSSDGDQVTVVTPTGMAVVDLPRRRDPSGSAADGDAPTEGTARDTARDTASVTDRDEHGRSERASDDNGVRRPTDLVEQPAKVMRIGSMVKSLLEEVRNAPLDDAGRLHLAQVHERSIAELKDGLAPELVEELDRIALPFGDGNPSDAELRIAQAQLVGWLEGLFHGIQTALVAQQMAAQAQLQQMRQLPPGMSPQGQGLPATGSQAQSPTAHHEGTGQYL